MFSEAATRSRSDSDVSAIASKRERPPFLASAASDEALTEPFGRSVQFGSAAVRGSPINQRQGEELFSGRKVGKLIVDASRTILWASCELTDFVGGDAPLAITGGRIAATTRANQLRLEQLLEAAQLDDRRHDTLLSSVGGRGTTALKAKGCPGGEGRIAMQARKLDEEFDLELPDFSSLYGLTPAEHQTLCLILNGLSMNEIALRLGKSVMTVRTHVKHAYSKLNITSKEQLFATTLKLG